MIKSFFAIFFSLVLCYATRAQDKGETLYELRGRIDETGATIIQGLPILKGQADSVVQEVKSINKVIFENKGKAIDVLNSLARSGYKLVTALHISDSERRASIDHVLIYYLRKK
jgi:hypothetical protein